MRQAVRKPHLARAEELLDYHPAYSIHEGLKETVEWYVKCREGSK